MNSEEIYSGTIWYNGYIFHCDKLEDFGAMEVITYVTVPEMIKKESEIQQMLFDMMIYGTGYITI